MPFVVRTEVSAVAINTTQLFIEAGMVGRWTGIVTREVTTNTRSFVPTNKRLNKSRRNEMWPVGSLKRSIRGYSTQTGQHTRDMTIYSDVPYARWVNNGTYNIVGNPEMYLPPNWSFGGKFGSRDTNPEGIPGLGNFKIRTEEGTWHRMVSGQRAVSFFQLGYEATRLHHRALGNLQSGIATSSKQYI